ncbi:putative porin [Sediminibacterium soli]|uniref:putative porin n=1 Tax=Sediminibacterium soli TaxID=2698829 RepID=UPI001379DEFF|nr:putative porin [Sediminibacterium soli]NCI45988.1 putative porin [Sediminibacterium soli]
MHLFSRKQLCLCLFLLVAGTAQLYAQVRTGMEQLRRNGGIGTGSVTYDSQGRMIKRSKGNDSLQRRNSNEDSITIFYHYFDSSRLLKLDSSINDFSKRAPVPWYYHTMGTSLTAAQSFLFNPLLKAGFDAGFHQYDIYRFTPENTRIYQTTRPYTELMYLLGSKAEQILGVTHTQNKKSNFNFSLEYRFGNSPGVLKTQNASQSNLRFTTHYQTNNRRYENFLILISNKSASSENGGLKDPAKLDSLALNDPFELDTRLGRSGALSRNPFNTTVNTGNTYRDFTALFRHHLDIGKRDSLVTDSVTIQLFYPRLRVEHTLRYTNASYQFLDYFPDSASYRKFYNYPLLRDTVSFKDAWTDISNEFSLISFPDKNNQAQFLKAGIVVQNLFGKFDDTAARKNLYNLYGIGEYRNRTRNQLWDIEATGQLYLNGYNAGDYAAYISMRRSLGNKLGNLVIGFQNVNRSPSFILDPLSRFPLHNRTGFGKENIIRLFGAYENPRNKWKLTGEYYAVSNYMYFDSFFSARQEATLFNVLHFSAEKQFRLSRYWNWYTEIHVQQATGQAPVNLPLLLTRNRIAFEGNFATNLFLSTGLEIRYYTPYKNDNYSPFTGQFFYQNRYSMHNRPDINAFVHFRIKSFKGFFRLENLNTLNPSGGFGFNKYNFASPESPYTGLWMRFGLWWSFVN